LCLRLYPTFAGGKLSSFPDFYHSAKYRLFDLYFKSKRAAC